MQKLIKTTDHGIMKFTTLDAVSGNTLADMLEVKHDKMMRTIKRVMKYEENRKKITPQVGVSHTPQVGSEIIHIAEEKELNFNAVFKEWEYLNQRGRKYKTFIMSEDAVYLVIANTQSAKAHELKVWFKSEFNKMRDEREIREESKSYQLGYTDALKALHIRRVAEGSKQPESQFYSTVARKIHRKATGRPMPKGGIDHCELSEIEETKVLILKAHIKNKLHYLMTTPAKEAKEIIYRLIEDTDTVIVR